MTQISQLKLTHRTQAKGKIILPGSKSISNRYLLLAALSEGRTVIHNLLASDDTERMKEALIALGINVTHLEGDSYAVEGVGGSFPNREASLFLGNAGTAFRSLTAALALNGGSYHLHGIPRMHERPIGDLVDALRVLGASIQYGENEGYPPLLIEPAQMKNLNVKVKGSVSSQYLTALLMALPMLGREVTIEIEGVLISKPYIDITLKSLKQFGIEVRNENYERFIIPEGATYRSPKEIRVEGDASSATYFLAAGALAGDVTVEGMGRASMQGDREFATHLEKMGAIVTWEDYSIRVEKPKERLSGLDIDCNDIPDAAMTFATMALFCSSPVTLRNIASWRVKETDRIHAMATELRKLGAKVEEGEDWISVEPLESINEDVSIATYDDHRIAMCFSLAAFKGALTILEPECVNKTVPDYFELFEAITE